MGMRIRPQTAVESLSGNREVAGIRGRPGKYDILDLAQLPMAIMEGARQIVCYVNPALCSLTGKDRGHMLGKPSSNNSPIRTLSGVPPVISSRCFFARS